MLFGPSALSHFSSSRYECGWLNTRSDQRPNTCGSRGVIDPKPADGNAVHDFHPGRKLVAPRHVVARARREHVNGGVPGQVLGDVAGVQLGAAVDVGAVALHHDSELHCAEGSGSSPESSLSAVAGRIIVEICVGRVVRRAHQRSGRHAAACRSLPATPLPSARLLLPSPRRCAAAATPASTPSAATASSGIRLAGLFLGRGPRLRRLHLSRLRLQTMRGGGGGCWALVRTRSRLLWLARGPGARPILDDAFERPRAPLVEVHPARQRLQPHLEIAVLDADARQLEHEVVHELVIQHVDFVALLALVAEKVELLLVERVDLGSACAAPESACSD